MVRRQAKLILTVEEEQTLTRWTHRRKSLQALAFRCRIVLSCAHGITNIAVAKKLLTTNPTAGKWRRRFIDKRLE